MIHAELSDDYAIHLGRKRVARWMRADGSRGMTLRIVMFTFMESLIHLN